MASRQNSGKLTVPVSESSNMVKKNLENTNIPAAPKSLSRRDFVQIAAAAGTAVAATGAVLPRTVAAAPKGPKTKIDLPIVTCAGSTEVSINLQVCAGESG